MWAAKSENPPIPMQEQEIIMITNLSTGTVRRLGKGHRLLTALITVIFACSVTVTAFAAANAYVTVTIVDGDKSVSISSKEETPEQIVSKAGFTLGVNDELDLTDYSADKGGTIVIDRAKLVRVDDNGLIAYFVGYSDTVKDVLDKHGIVLGEGDEADVDLSQLISDKLHMFIKRAFTVSIESDGEFHKLAIANGTVGDAIAKAGIELGSNDKVYPSLDTVLTGFTTIKISRVKYETKLERKSVPFETETVKSSEMYVDESEIIKEGVEGEKTVFYTEKYVDGELCETIFSKERITKEPVNAVKKVGTKQREALSAYKNTDAAISKLTVPSSLELDENGIPVNYKYAVQGKATAYTGDPATASGRTPMPGHIAVDPKEYPYGTELYVVSSDGSYVYGYCIAADTGGFVKKGNTDIDLYMPNVEMCGDWGNRGVTIYVL